MGSDFVFISNMERNVAGYRRICVYMGSGRNVAVVRVWSVPSRCCVVDSRSCRPRTDLGESNRFFYASAFGDAILVDALSKKKSMECLARGSDSMVLYS